MQKNLIVCILSAVAFVTAATQCHAQANNDDGANSTSNTEFELGQTGQIDDELTLIEGNSDQDANPNAGAAGGGFNARGANNFFSAFNQAFNQLNTTNQSQQVRVPLRLGFKYDGPSAASRTAKLDSRVAATKAFSKLGNFAVIINGKTATLDGQVDSEHAKKLAEQFAKFEPGVYRVVNNLTVATAAESSEQLPPPRVAN